MSNAMAAFGTLLQYEDPGDPGEFITVAEVKDLSGPGMTSDVLDTTSHTSAGAFREKIASLIDAGEVTFSINYVPVDATHDNATGLVSFMRTRVNMNWQLVWPDTAETLWAFPGIVTAFSPGAAVEDLLSADVTITLTGAPTLA